MSDDPPRVAVERDGDVAAVVFDGPGEVPVIDERTAAEFTAAIETIENSDARVAVVRGAAGTFCAGGDLAQSPEAFVRTVEKSIDGILDIFTSDIPYVAAIRGAAIGGGLEIAMACDFRITGEDATLALPEASLGIIPPAGAIRFLTHTVGRASALELVLTGRRLDGTEAADRGVVTEALSDEAVYGRAAGLADELGSNSAAALAAVKKSVNAAFPRPIDDTMWDLELARSLAKGEDFAEGKQAFVEGRQPDFRE